MKRIFARFFAIRGYPGEMKVQNLLWKKAEESLPVDHSHGAIETYTQALMDLGATVCTRHTPRCESCPLQSQCVAFQEQCIDQLPTAKPRKVLPQKEIVFLLLLQQQKLLLQKRAASGIWGALWCPPEIATGIDAADYCQHQLGIRVEQPLELPALDHQFTHFKLRIHPRLLHVVSDSRMTEPESIWINPADALEHGIPAPVRKLLKQNFLSDNLIADIQVKNHG